MQEKRLRHSGGMMITGFLPSRLARAHKVLTVLTTYSVKEFPYAKVLRVTPSKHEQLCLIRPVVP